MFVCQGRAVADGRIGVGSFADPIAGRLLSEAELTPVRMARRGAAVADARERYAVRSVVSCAEVVAPRTVLIDAAVTEAIERRADSQVVLLGAGLDGRPWRLAALRDVTVMSVDHPASQADLRRRARGLPAAACDLRFVAVDLARGQLAPALAAGGHDPRRPTVWVWEGVIPYLARQEVADTLDALTAVSGEGSTLVAQYQSRSVAAQLGRAVAGLVARASGVPSPLAGEPWRSLWSEARMGALLTGRGWAVETDLDLLEYARRIGTPTESARSLVSGRVVLARVQRPVA